MSTYLIFDGVNDVVTLPTPMVCNTGTDSWVWEFSIAISSYPTSGNRYFIGSNNASTNSGIGLRPASGDGALALVVAGSNVSGFTSPTGYILNDGALHTYRVERDASTGVRFYRDNMVTPFATVSWVTASTLTLTIGRFGAGSMATSGITAFNLEYLDFVSGFSNAEKWDSNLSGGTGSILPTVSGSNQGTLVNFPTDGTQWETTGGSPLTSTIEGGLPVPVAASNLTIATSALTASILAGIPSLTASAVMRFPLSTLSINTGLPVPTANVVTQGGVSVSTDNSYQNRKLQLIAEAKAAFPNLPINSAILEFLKLRYSENSNINVLILRFLREA